MSHGRAYLSVCLFVSLSRTVPNGEAVTRRSVFIALLAPLGVPLVKLRGEQRVFVLEAQNWYGSIPEGWNFLYLNDGETLAMPFEVSDMRRIWHIVDDYAIPMWIYR